MTKMTTYRSVIYGDRLLVWRVDFPLQEIMQPPEGWAFNRVSEWRKGCPDQCWRVVYARAAKEGK